MANDQSHRASVDAWLERTGGVGIPAEPLTQIFEEGFNALWRRAHRTLGEVTLTAIADRVLHNASEQFPAFSTLRIEPTGLQYDELRVQVAALDHEQLITAFRFVLVEFLTILGALTAEILTPALHAELAKLAPMTTNRTERAAKDPARLQKTRGEESKS